MTEPESGSEARTPVVYVYGLVPADVEVKEGTTGVGRPAGELALVIYEDIAALVSEVDPDSPLGTPDDLRRHAEILDSTATVAPVLPLRFGAVMTDADAVATELLEPNRDEFHDALTQLEGHVEYVVKARYVESSILREVLSEDPEIARLRDVIRERPEEATRDERLAIGERISRALAAKREEDTERLAEALRPVASALSVREATDDEDAGIVAVLIAVDEVDALDEAVTELSENWQDRAELTVLGPLAAYDFVFTRVPENSIPEDPVPENAQGG